MNKEKFEGYLNDENISKFEGAQYGCFHPKDCDVVIYFSFFHSIFDMPNPEGKRINFEIKSLHTYQGPSPREIGGEVLVLVNSDSPNYAVLFKITIDVGKRIAKLEVVEASEVDFILTAEEKDGIVLSF